MNFVHISLATLISLGFLIAGSVNNPNAEILSQEMAQSGHPRQSQGGQVVEVGAYHLELITAKENNGIHLDLFLQKGDNHQAISNAKVTGQIQLPNGNQKNLTFKYDAAGKHYTTFLSEKTAGQYQLKITADINGQKINGRFSFKQ